MIMAGHFKRLSGLFTRYYATVSRQNYNTTHHAKTTISGPSVDDHDCQVEIGVTSDGQTIVCYHPSMDVPYELTQVMYDGQTIVCYHPSMDVPYELTQPIPRQDPVTNLAENHDQVLKAHLSREVLQNKKKPTIEELSTMFYTTKHRWYPVGQYHLRRRKGDPPKDR